MAGMTGANKNATVYTNYTQLDVQTSAQGLPIPIIWGKTAVAGNLIDAGNFQANPLGGGGGKKGSSGGGKGGGGGSKKGVATNYDYTADIILALCEGPIQGIGNVYVNQVQLTWPTGLDTVPDTEFTGTASQSPWTFLNMVSYAYTAYVAGHDVDFGSTPVAPNYRFEIIGPFSGSMPSGPDANPADIINDFLTNPQYGIGFGLGVGNAGSFIDDTSWTLYKTYCQAQQLLFSPCLDTQEQISQIIKRWADLSNTWIFWSGGALKFVPLGDSVVTDGFVTYTPNNTAIFDLNYDHFVFQKGQAPITVTITDQADRPNTVKLEIKYREGYYDAYPIEWKDQGLVDTYGQVNAPVSPAHDIVDPAIGAVSAQLLGQRAAYIARTYGFKLGWEFYWLEPGDIVTVTDPHIGFNLWPVRIRTMDEDDKGNWTVSAEEFPAGLASGQGSGTAVGTQAVQPGVTTSFINQLVAPGDVNPPMIWEPESTFTSGVAQLWIAASGGVDWGGCNVFLSFDGVNYALIGPLVNPARQGTLTANLATYGGVNPDTIHTLSVDLTESQGSFSNDATDADGAAGRTLCLITDAFSTAAPCVGELLAYGASTLTATFKYDLTDLYRGLVGTPPAAWSSGSFFTRIDLGSPAAGALGPTLLVYDLPAQYIGQTVHLKFCSFNRFGAQQQDISSVTDYTYTPCGTGFGTAGSGLPQAPTGLTATGEIGGVFLTWAANAVADNVQDYQVWRAPGLSSSFGSASLVATTPALTWFDTGLAAASQWTYFLVAVNAVGSSSPTAGVNATVATAAQNVWYTPMSVPGKFSDLALDPWDGNYEIFDVQAPTALTFPTNFSTSPTPGCEIAPAGNVTLTFQTIHAGTPTTVGTMTISASATTGSFSVSAGFVLPAGDRLRCYAPSTVDTTIAGVFATIAATR